jgi:hypothetical protein
VDPGAVNPDAGLLASTAELPALVEVAIEGLRSEGVREAMSHYAAFTEMSVVRYSHVVSPTH